MNIYFDTEFTGLNKNTTIISIGLVSQCGKTFYAEFTDYHKSQVNSWLQENVINKLGITPNAIIGTKQEIKIELEKWLSQFDKIIMISDCLAYDWVLFCDIFGTAFDIPSNVYYIPIDICTMLMFKGIDPDINREEFAMKLSESTINTDNKHNALHDAQIIKTIYNGLIKN